MSVWTYHVDQKFRQFTSFCEFSTKIEHFLRYFAHNIIWKQFLFKILLSAVFTMTEECNKSKVFQHRGKCKSQQMGICTSKSKIGPKSSNLMDFWFIVYIQAFNNHFKWMKGPAHLSYYHLKYISHRASRKWAIFTTKYRVKCAKISLKEGKWPKKKRSSLAPRSHSGSIKLVFSCCTSLWE